mgnify:FL=1
MPQHLDMSKKRDDAPKKTLIYGDVGSGKTFCLRTLPDRALPAFIIDIDEGSEALEGDFTEGNFKGIIPDRLAKNKNGKEIPVAYDQIKDALQRLHKADPEVQPKTIIIDSMTRLYGAIMDHTMASNNKALDAAPTQPDYGIAMRLTIKFIEALIMMQKNLIIVCHEDSKENETTGIVKIVPSLTGKLAGIIPSYFDYVLHAVVKGKGDKASYIWQTRPSGVYTARVRNPNLEAEMPQNFDTLLP